MGILVSSNSIYQPATPDHLWMRYAQTRTMLDFTIIKRSFRLTPFGMIMISVATMAGKIINIKESLKYLINNFQD